MSKTVRLTLYPPNPIIFVSLFFLNISKKGTKHAAFTCNPLSFTNFAETDSLTTVDISVVERYPMKVLAGVRSNTTVDTFVKFRYDSYLNRKALFVGHIRRCFCVIRNAITLLKTHQYDLLPQNFGWTNEGGVMTQPIPPELLVCSLCGGRCETRKCSCKTNKHLDAVSSVTKSRERMYMGIKP